MKDKKFSPVNGVLRLSDANSELGNLQSKYSSAEVLLLSFPKSGRTWVRYLIARYLEIRYDIPFDIEFRNKPEQVKRFLFSHNYFDIFRYVYGEPRILFQDSIAGKTLILLIRDPRDVVVSYFHHIKSRDGLWPFSIASFMFSEIFGLERQSKFVLQLMDVYEKHGHSKILVRYEKLHADPLEMFKKILNLILNEPIDMDALDQAVRSSSFSSMQKHEFQVSKTEDLGLTRFGMADWDGDPNKLKVRKGKPGGFKDELPWFLRYSIFFMPRTRELLKRLKTWPEES